MISVQAKDKWPAECKDRLPQEIQKKSGLATLLTLKIGDRVMLLRNVDTEVGLYNGALGTVTGFLPATSPVPSAILVLFDNDQIQQLSRNRYPALNGSFPVERAEAKFPLRRSNSSVEATRLQFPLRVAFAMTIHKCQGQTLDSVVVSLKGYFSPGQAYVALSRCKHLSDLYITDFNKKSIKCNKSGLQAVQMMTDDQPLTVPHASWLSATTDTSSMKLVLLNTRSITRHADDITNNVYLSVSNAAVFTETRLSSDSLPLQFQHKRVLHVNAPRQHNYVGGVAVVVSSTIFIRELFRHSSDTCQLLVVQVECRSHCVVVVAVYRSPVLSMTDFNCTLKT